MNEHRRLRELLKRCVNIEELSKVEEEVREYHRDNPGVDVEELLLEIAYKKQFLLEHRCDPYKLRKIR
ncbi:MAG: hypothetical protein ACE5GD_04320 [Candidatus Geothermarchaeales archaeon]